MRQAAARIGKAAKQLRSLAEEVDDSSASAPSYDGQFGPQVQALGSEISADALTTAAKLSSLSEALLIKADEFEAADQETQGGFAGLFAQFRSWLDSLGLSIGPPASSPWTFLSPDFKWLFGDPGPDDGRPWYAPMATELSKAWDWYHRNFNLPVYDILETWRGIGENGRRIALYHLAQIWFAYDKAVNQPIYEDVATWRGNLDNARTIVLYGLARLWFGYDATVNQPIYSVANYGARLYSVQGPGPDPDGPIIEYMEKFVAIDASGNPISPVASELTRLIEAHELGVTFFDINNSGIVPLQDYVVLPPNFADGGQANAPANVGLVAHELTHVLERDLNDSTYWPDGRAPNAAGFPIGDSTTYMEVLSNIVGQTVEYDYLSQIPPASRLPSQTDRLLQIQDNLATFTDADAHNATRYLVKSDNGVEVYRENYVHELGFADHRIPTGGWGYWLKQMGFSDAAINHISGIASQGQAISVDPAELDPQTGRLATATPTSTPTTTPTPSPTSTQTATASPSPTSTSSPPSQTPTSTP
jgi:cell division septation protein DedD